MRPLGFLILIVFAALSLTLPFALSTCDGGIFCMASTGHAERANACPSHDDAHLSLFAQFGECAPQQSVQWVTTFIMLLAGIIVWTISQRFARSFLGLHHFYLDARGAPGTHAHMKPFDPLLFAFARGIIHNDHSKDGNRV